MATQFEIGFEETHRMRTKRRENKIDGPALWRKLGRLKNSS
jgi:hypothetical protein